MYQYLFGPVPSRRLGMSLGVDLVPHKVCSFNCVYCECGRTTRLTVARDAYVPLEAVTAELEHYLAHHRPPDFFTFSGAGEPTLNSHLDEVLAFIRERAPKARTAVITNASLIDDPQVRAELAAADVVMPSLDAATERTFRRMDRPSPRVRLQPLLDGLVAFRDAFPGAIWLEVVILPGYNDHPEDLAALREALVRIRADRIQLNTLDRPGTQANLQPAPREQLERIASEWGLGNVHVVGAAPPPATEAGYRSDGGSNTVLATLARRPCTADDLAHLLGLPTDEVTARLATLEAEGQITAVVQERGVFYQATDRAARGEAE
ncbi:radical SAM protein [Halorhodospira halophila]|uniref:radical SAM protein n=1 Tax=Halorhodospira halophila TaxID=1053 RepID=UPI0019136582|nr:radical SAM protein [Halorhodospira halophila]